MNFNFSIQFTFTALFFTIYATNPTIAITKECKSDISVSILSHVVTTKIQLHYSQTVVQRLLHNNNWENEEVHVFKTIVPNSAYISDFYIDKGSSISRGGFATKNSSSSSVSLWVRNANIVTFQLTLRPGSEVKIVLVYNEILERKHGYYQQISYITPDLIENVPTLKITTNIDENRKLKFVRLPFNEQDARINEISPNNTEIRWLPRTNSHPSVPCSVVQYAVQYDLEDGDDGDIIIRDGFFFHFFTPVNLEPIRKHVIFLLDVSGSMSGQKMTQMKTAMIQILSDLKPDDYFNMIIFESAIRHYLTNTHPIEASTSNIQAAQAYVRNLNAGGGTSINAAFTHTFGLIGAIQNNQSLPESVETLVIFLTDGAPTDATTTHIIANVNIQNADVGVPIYSLAFGVGADKAFLEQLSRQNYGISKEIFDASDAAEQLKDFYNEISSPVLTNISIVYESEDFDITELTIQNFTSISDGAAIRVSGKLTPKVPGNGPFKLTIVIRGQGRDGPVTITKEILISPTRTENIKTSSFVEKLWAHITIKQLIDDHLATGNVTSKVESQTIALRHGFVTPYTIFSASVSKCLADIIVDLVSVLPPANTNCSTATSPEISRKDFYTEMF